MEAKPAKLTNLPIPIEDQTMESLAALILINNRHLDPKTFGLDEAAPRRSVGDAAAQKAAKAIISTELLSPTALFYGHRYEAISAPFVGSLKREQFIQSGFGPKDRRRQLRYVTAKQRICPECLRQDFDSLGFSATRRAHQYVGVRVCHIHCIFLIELDSENLRWTECNGLHLDNEGIASRMAATHPRQSLPKISYCLRYSRLVNAATTGRLGTVADLEPMSVFGQRFSKRHYKERNPESIAILISSLLDREVPIDVLEEVGLTQIVKDEASWVAASVLSTTYTRHPFSNLIIGALISDSPEDFQNMLENGNRVGIRVEAGRLGASPAHEIALAQAISRQYAHGRETKHIISFFNITKQQLKILRSRHRAIFLDAVTHANKIKSEASHRSLKIFNECFPAGSRELFYKVDPVAYRWFMKHDKHSLDQKLPQKSGGRRSKAILDCAISWLRRNHSTEDEKDAVYTKFCTDIVVSHQKLDLNSVDKSTKDFKISEASNYEIREAA